MRISEAVHLPFRYCRIAIFNLMFWQEKYQSKNVRYKEAQINRVREHNKSSSNNTNDTRITKFDAAAW